METPDAYGAGYRDGYKDAEKKCGESRLYDIIMHHISCEKASTGIIQSVQATFPDDKNDRKYKLEIIIKRTA